MKYLATYPTGAECRKKWGVGGGFLDEKVKGEGEEWKISVIEN